MRMKLAKALVETGMARSGAEAQRLVKQGAIIVGGCISPCNPRKAPYNPCTCGGWRKITNPAEEVKGGEVMRIGCGNWRLLKKEGSQGFDQVQGIAYAPFTDEEYSIIDKLVVESMRAGNGTSVRIPWLRA
jgi:hypothetical protein